MSYQVLARKWRPKSFESLVGQEHVVRALTHALSDQRLHHAYLFTGTRGVGKTTLARILAKSLNCETGVTATPCGVCSACTEIDAGRFVDLLEVDAATNTKVDEMRQLLENAVYAPTRGRFKVYVIDEVHMLSNSAFNAMLKTLEEPPEHVKFILATTDPQKIPVTVLSRCLQFNLKQMTPPLISGHLRHILEVEGVAADAAALNLLARSASGSMRDALSLLDQAIAHGAGKVDEDQVRDMLGTVDLDYLYSILDALLADDVSGMLQVADAMATRSLSFDEALQELAALFTRLQIAQLAPQAIADDLPERERLLALAGQFDPEFIQLGYQIAVHGRKELPLAPDEQAGFVMTLLRLHTFRPADDGDMSPPPAARPKAPPVTRPAPAKSPVSAPAPASEAPPTPRMSEAPVPERRPAAIETVIPEAPGAREVQPAAAPPAQKVSAPSQVSGDWHDILPALGVSGMARELGQHCLLQSVEETRVVLCLSPAHRHLQIKPAQDKLQQALSEYFGRPLSLRIDLDEVAGDTPAVTAQRRRQERQEQAVASLEQDEFVREAIDLFDATVIESSIKPISTN
ncbi:DNA polymerase III subunit gamma/tau [uncultured Propionivibrio sp.]|uniref:DNA polymerase III subunit gamma/tau n=1 Tax=uncultured Propionivibrio sp. TaxID=426737 RepID=UPI0029C0A916|nr:DNA polymerase III subunit gamma/tau [uncultured Propionivibrio sp.]